MKVGRFIALAVVVIATSACYRQVVNTGRTPGPTVIDRPWTNAFFWGLAAPAPIDVSAQCRSGIATVVTEQSVANGFATIFTLGIYSPRHVTVTCATGSAMRPGMLELVVARDASPEERERVFAKSAHESARLLQPVVVRF